MTQAAAAIIKWQYWLFNHDNPKEIIETVFPDLSNHLYEKFKIYAYEYQNTAFAWARWFMDLSRDRQDKFAEYILQNYHGVDNRLK